MTTITSKTQPISSVTAPGWVRRHPLVTYFAIAFAGTWATIIPLALSSGLGLFTLPDWINVIAFGLVAVVLIAATRGKLAYREELGSGFNKYPPGVSSAWRVFVYIHS